jgi:hypothetical protein
MYLDETSFDDQFRDSATKLETKRLLRRSLKVSYFNLHIGPRIRYLTIDLERKREERAEQEIILSGNEE